MKLRFAFTILISMTLLSSCSTVNKTIDSIGGLFTKKGDRCTGPNCEVPSLIDNDQTAKKWHCYGQQDSDDWQCQTNPDPSQIVSIQPEPPKPLAPRPTASKPAASQLIVTQTEQVETTTPPTPVSIKTNTDESGNSASDLLDVQLGNQNSSLLEQPESYYTIQLIALPERSEILAYAKANGITSPLTARINSQGIPWHVLLLGIYPDQSTAEQAKNEWVGAKTLEIKPWVRPLGALQEAMREAATDS